MNDTKKGLKKRIKSFSYAFNGILTLVHSEPNAKIHLLATIGVVIAGFLFRISKIEWCIICMAIALVWTLEALNTAAERIIDHLFPEYHETAKIVKDLTAGAVLIGAIGALTCGLIIFIPKLVGLF